MAFDISGPGAGGGGWRNSEHLDHLVVFVNPLEEQRDGRNGKYVVAVCGHVICLDDKAAFDDVAVSGAALAPRLLTAVSSIVVAHLVEGDAKEGQNAPVLPGDPTPTELERVQNVLDQFAAKLPGGRVVFDTKSYNEPGVKPADPDSF